jgi:hypothetical protein
MHRLEPYYKVRFVNEHGRCAHEFIIDFEEFDATAGVKIMDVAKRLQVRPSLIVSSMTAKLTTSFFAGLRDPPADLLVASLDRYARTFYPLYPYSLHSSLY